MGFTSAWTSALASALALVKVMTGMTSSLPLPTPSSLRGAASPAKRGGVA